MLGTGHGSIGLVLCERQEGYRSVQLHVLLVDNARGRSSTHRTAEIRTAKLQLDGHGAGELCKVGRALVGKTGRTASPKGCQEKGQAKAMRRAKL